MKAPSNSPDGGEFNTQPSLFGDASNQIESSKSEVQSEAQMASSVGGNQRLGTTSGEEADYYLNETGLVVFTGMYLLERGYCCGSGCKHCPYNYEAVAEPKRSHLLEQKERDAK